MHIQPDIKVKISALLNMSHLSQDEQDKMIEHIKEEISKKIFDSACIQLSDEDQEKLEEISKSEKIEDVVVFKIDSNPSIFSVKNTTTSSIFSDLLISSSFS